MRVDHHSTISCDVPYSAEDAEKEKTKAEERTKLVWRQADCVCFDVDSTVCQDEAIDELADFMGVGEAVAKVTREAMNGNMRFREALRSRLNVMKPSKGQIEKFLLDSPPKLTPGIARLITTLQKRSVPVYLVSGGFRSLIEPVADTLRIPRDQIYANRLLFNEDDSYAAFDETELTSDSGNQKVGKAGVCAFLKKKYGYQNLVMIGDGVTDMEACPPADAFIGFGGNQVRESVLSKAAWYVTEFVALERDLM